MVSLARVPSSAVASLWRDLFPLCGRAVARRAEEVLAPLSGAFLRGWYPGLKPRLRKAYVAANTGIRQAARPARAVAERRRPGLSPFAPSAAGRSVIALPLCLRAYATPDRLSLKRRSRQQTALETVRMSHCLSSL
jgi:hypothetical protein